MEMEKTMQGVPETKEAVQEALENIAERREQAQGQNHAQVLEPPGAEQPKGQEEQEQPQEAVKEQQPHVQEQGAQATEERTPQKVMEEAMEKLAAAQEGGDPPEIKEITLKFGRGCVKDTFTAKDGKDYTCILIPNQDKEDKRPWQTFVVRANHVHEDKFGKGMWIKLPAEGHTTLHRNMIVGEGEDGKKIWETQKEKVSNVDLKKMVEAYKTKDRDKGQEKPIRRERPRESFKEKLGEQKVKLTQQAQSHAPKQHNKNKDTVL